MTEDQRELGQERPFTDALPPFADMVTGVAGVEPEEASDDAVDIEDIRISFPVELEVEQDEAGTLQVRGAPPLLRTRTGFMPVYHQLSLRIVREASRGD